MKKSKEVAIQRALAKGLSPSSTKKGSGRTHVNGWNKKDSETYNIRYLQATKSSRYSHKNKR